MKTDEFYGQVSYRNRQDWETIVVDGEIPRFPTVEKAEAYVKVYAKNNLDETPVGYRILVDLYEDGSFIYTDVATDGRIE